MLAAKIGTLAQGPWDLSVSAHADSGFVDTSTLVGIDKYAAVQAAGGAFFTSQGVAVLNIEDEKYRFYELKNPLEKLSAWPTLPFRISMAAIANQDPRGRVILGRDADGDEEFRLYACEPQYGKLAPWPMPSGRASQIQVAPGSQYFVYAFNPSDSRFWDIRRGHWDSSFQDTVILREAGIWAPLDLNQNGDEVLLARTVSAFHTELYTLSLSRKALGKANLSNLRRLPPLQSASTVSWAQWIKSPRPGFLGQVAMIADGQSEFARLYLWDASLSDSLRALSKPCDCEVEQALVLPVSRQIVYALNHKGISEFYVVNPISGISQPILGLPEGVLVHWQPDSTGKKLIVTLSDFSTPGDFYVVDMNLVAQGKPAAKLWMRALGSDQLPKPKFRVKSPRHIEVTPPDPLPPPQQKIPAWVVLPERDSASPYVMHLHGGPELQSRPGWDPFDRYMTEQWGIAFVYPNVRGSTGYGRAFQAADDQVRRFKVIRDMASIHDSVKTWPEFKSTRSALLGRSYGGFLSQAGAIDLWPRFSAAISQVGITDFPLFLSQTSSYRADLRRMEYGDERDSVQRIFLDSLSPLQRMGKLRVPLLLIHGLNDPRVPFSQSFMAYQSLFSRDAPALLLTQRSEGHAARDKATRIAQMQLMTQFLLKSLQIPPRR